MIVFCIKNGVVNYTHVYNKIVSCHALYLECQPKCRHFVEVHVNIFGNGDIVHCALGNGADSYVNEGQCIVERVSSCPR